MSFPKPDQFQNQDVNAWGALETNKVYKLIEINNISTKSGMSYIADLIDESGIKYKVWVPQAVFNKINENGPAPMYILNYGPEYYGNNDSKFYYSISILKC